MHEQYGHTTEPAAQLVPPVRPKEHRDGRRVARSRRARGRVVAIVVTIVALGLTDAWHPADRCGTRGSALRLPRRSPSHKQPRGFTDGNRDRFGYGPQRCSRPQRRRSPGPGLGRPVTLSVLLARGRDLSQAGFLPDRASRIAGLPRLMSNGDGDPDLPPPPMPSLAPSPLPRRGPPASSKPYRRHRHRPTPRRPQRTPPPAPDGPLSDSLSSPISSESCVTVAVSKCSIRSARARIRQRSPAFGALLHGLCPWRDPRARTTASTSPRCDMATPLSRHARRLTAPPRSVAHQRRSIETQCSISSASTCPWRRATVLFDVRRSHRSPADPRLDVVRLTSRAATSRPSPPRAAPRANR